MATAETTLPSPLAGPAAKASDARADATAATPGQAVTLGELKPGRFIPVTRFAIMDRLLAPGTWSSRDLEDARRFFRYLDYWRHQRHTSDLLELEQTYEPFSPDSDLFMTRAYAPEERRAMQTRLFEQMASLLDKANYEKIDPSDVAQILTQDSTYGLDFDVDMETFEDILLYYRGATSKRDSRRRWRKFFLKEEFDVPIYQRLCLIFKLKPATARIREVMAKQKIGYKEAEKVVKRQRAMLHAQVKEDNVYMKLFKNIPRNDIEMVFPNTQIKFRLFDKLKLSAGATGGVGATVFGTVAKVGLFTNPFTAIPAIFGIGIVVFRQIMNFAHQKQRYLVVMSQNLYFHSMADNRGVTVLLADTAAEEDVKEEMLLYSVLAKEKATSADLRQIDRAIEQYLKSTFDATVDFDLDDALKRLVADGIVTNAPDGTFLTMPPAQAAKHLDDKWDKILDHLSDTSDADEGVEVGSSMVPPPEPSTITAPEVVAV